MPKGCFKVATAFVVVVFLLVTSYHVCKPANTLSISHLSHFTVVLDCGSTGSRVNVYKWIKNGTGDEDHPVLLQTSPDHLNKGLGEGATCQYHCMQTEPGLDKFVHNASGIREAIEPLILWVEQHVPPERHGDTSLFVLATAGLRKLPTEDADWILDTVETVVKAHPFVYRRSWIRVLSGQEEGYYGWAALNYKMGTLRNSIKVPTFGVLDMGGSSLQVVMETHTLRESHHIVRSKLGSLEHKILAYSMTEFGLNEAFDRSVVMLSEEKSLTRNNGGRIQLRHPCLSSSVSLNYTCRVCFHPNATNWEADFSVKLPKKQSDSLSLVGVSDWKQCKELATRAASIRSSNTELLQLIMDMNGKVNLSSSESGLQNLTVFPLQGARFHALSGFFAVYDVLNLNPNDNLTTIMTRAQELCSHLWSGSKKFPGNRKYAEQFCFNVPYLASLIKDVLCMGNTNLIFGPGDVSWTLGAALVEGKSAWLHTLEAQGGSTNFEIMKVLTQIDQLDLAIGYIKELKERIQCMKVTLTESIHDRNKNKDNNDEILTCNISISIFGGDPGCPLEFIFIRGERNNIRLSEVVRVLNEEGLAVTNVSFSSTGNHTGFFTINTQVICARIGVELASLHERLNALVS